ncbi:MAG: NUDIX domain-containing protein [Bacteroidales bacterium]|nr:NUDIX domain-containing protein [Bacteroidales bacterium]
MFKIYYNNKIILLSESETTEKSFTKIYFLDEDKIKLALNIFLNSDDLIGLNIYGKVFTDVPPFLKNQFIFIRAAGGIVKDFKGRILYINRLGYYDFPKGKAELGETDEITAIREVSEECGIKIADLQIEKKIGNVYHIYPYKKSFALKETAWFLMRFNGNYSLTPQSEEDITAVGWLNYDEISVFEKGTYPSLRGLLGMI